MSQHKPVPPWEIQLRCAYPQSGFSADVSMALNNGITVLFGPSGSGKTTLLRALAGLEPCEGVIRCSQTVWLDTQSCVPTHQRNLGMVFQEGSALEHLTVAGNLQFARQRARDPLSTPAQSELLELLKLSALLSRRPRELSGGERQRLALARALIINPDMLLLDEPLSALDKQHSEEILNLLQQFNSKRQRPILYVTHSVDELTRLADEVVLIEHGKNRLQASLNDMLLSPLSAQALGEDVGVVIEGTVIETADADALLQVETKLCRMWIKKPKHWVGQKTVRIRVLAKDVSLSVIEPVGSSIQNHAKGTVLTLEPDTHPSQIRVKVLINGEPLLSRITRRAINSLKLKSGSEVWCLFKSAGLMV